MRGLSSSEAGKILPVFLEELAKSFWNKLDPLEATGRFWKLLENGEAWLLLLGDTQKRPGRDRLKPAT